MMMSQEREQDVCVMETSKGRAGQRSNWNLFSFIEQFRSWNDLKYTHESFSSNQTIIIVEQFMRKLSSFLFIYRTLSNGIDVRTTSEREREAMKNRRNLINLLIARDGERVRKTQDNASYNYWELVYIVFLLSYPSVFSLLWALHDCFFELGMSQNCDVISTHKCR